MPFVASAGASISLRATRPADYGEIASWIPDADACIRWAGPRVTFPFSVDELPRLLDVPNGESWCLGDDGAAPRGFGQFWPYEPNAVHLGRIIVSPAVRGKGYGRELCRGLIAKAIQSTGASVVTLRVYRDNATAVALYRSLGFDPVESQSTPYALFMRMQVESFGDAVPEPGAH